MLYNERHGNIFAVTQEYTKVQCISEDAAMGCGIAKQFVNIYGYNFKKYVMDKIAMDGLVHPNIIFYPYATPPVINLISKKYYNNKPTLDDLKICIDLMKRFCIDNNINKLVMPRIGCGKDNLDWEIIREYIKDTFDDMDIEIQVRVKD